MTDNELSCNTDRKGKGTTRRGFLGKIGAGGLAFSALQFARSAPAFASNYGCCNLAHYPPTIGYSQCNSSKGHYTWTCYYGCNECHCCETSGDAKSGAYCGAIGAGAVAYRPDC